MSRHFSSERYIYLAPLRAMMNDELRAEALIQLLGESRAIPGEEFASLLIPASKRSRALNWHAIPEEALPTPIVLQSLHLEQGIEGLYQAAACSMADVNRLRSGLIADCVDFLRRHESMVRLDDPLSRNAREVGLKARLYFLDLEACNRPAGDGRDATRQALKRIESLAGKSLYDFPGLYRSTAHGRDSLTASVEIYARHFKQDPACVVRVDFDRKRRVIDANREIQSLYASNRDIQ